MLIEPELNAQHCYPQLLEKGFRRSGDDVYRPHCPQCNACQSLRISTQQFKPSRGQKRISSKNKTFRIEQSHQAKPQYFELYQRYINLVHHLGPMFPATLKQYEQFIHSSWNHSLFIEIYDQDKLIAVSVTDIITQSEETSWSAFYCFYDPAYRSHSLGKFAILTQLKLAKNQNIKWLYLGYYIQQCNKMNYKTQFTPHQRFIDEKWITFS